MKRAGFTLCLLTLLAGCAHSPSIQTTLPPEIGNSHLLYLQSEPHRSLYVEVDAVKGAEPSETELNKLRAFLHQWCEKPDGITVVRSSVIPRSAARGNSALSLTRQYMDGPAGANNAAQPAYLYVLFYDNRVNRNPMQSPRSAAQWPARDTVPPQLAKPESPHVNLFPYPAMIYSDRSWMAGLLPGRYQAACSIHEAGHVLGLVRRESRAKGLHCPIDWCFMHANVSENVKRDVITWLKREEPKPYFCEGCAAELRQSRTAAPGTSMRFIGPVLVRTMQSYHVLFLPGACGLYIVDSLETELPTFISEFRNQDPGGFREKELWLRGKIETEQSRESLLQTIEAAKQDPVAAVRKLAFHLEGIVRTEITNGVAKRQSKPD